MYNPYLTERPACERLFDLRREAEIKHSAQHWKNLLARCLLSWSYKLEPDLQPQLIPVSAELSN